MHFSLLKTSDDSLVYQTFNNLFIFYLSCKKNVGAMFSCIAFKLFCPALCVCFYLKWNCKFEAVSNLAQRF